MIFNNNPIFIEPHLWGEHYWYVIESVIISMDTKEKPSREFVSFFFYSLQNILPCPTCREHYQKYFQKYDIEKILTSKKKLFLWIYNLRNEIQKRNGKSFISFETYLKELEKKYNPKEENNSKPTIENNFQSL